MRTGAAWRILAAVLTLSVSGCEYWDNLTGDKTVAKTSLSLAALDALTNGGMAQVHCRDSVRGYEFDLDAQGRYHDGNAGTGIYDLVCTCPWYFDETIRITATRAGTRDTLRFARKGGSEWYPDESWQVRIPLADAALRYPTRLAWTAQPADSAGHFRYAWTFASTPRLDRKHESGPVQAKHLLPYFAADANAAAGVEAGPDTACLTVFSRLRGQEYEIGKDCRAFAWVRNKPPAVDIDPKGNVTSYKVGCGPNPVRPLVVAGDSDGTCRLRLFTKDTLSSLGNLDTTLACLPAQSPRLQLGKPANPNEVRDSAGRFPNTLYAEVTDDNGEKSYDSLQFFTYPNLAPKSRSGMRHPRNVYFPGDSVWFWVEGHDEDGSIDSAVFYYTGRGQVTIPNPASQQQSFKAETFKVFTDTGKFTVNLFTMDNCEEPGHTWIPIEIRKNTPPAIVFESPRKLSERDTLFHVFNLTVQDSDIDNQLDSLTQIKVFWGDGKTTTLSTANGERPKKLPMYHYYAKPPDNGTQYRINIEVRDAHQGDDLMDTLLTY